GGALSGLGSGASGCVTALPGGGPCNVARTIARLGGTCQFLGKLSDDTFGEQLQASLQRDGVKIAVANVTPAPTTLAIARLDKFGTAEYRFYLDGTSAAQLGAADRRAEILDGPAPVGIHTASYERSVPAPVVEVVDTIGAGDAFVAGFLTWWTAHALTQHDAARPGALVSATTAAIAVAAANCTVRGANLPTGFRWSTVSPGFAQARDR